MGEKRDRVTTVSASVVDERLEKLRDIAPEVVGEAGVDWEKLQVALGSSVDDRPDRYRFEWAGKRDAISLLQRRSSGRLAPVPKESITLESTQNLFIEGENLEILKLLYRPYAGCVKLIYIDPPYNTGNDFVYRDDYRKPLQAYLTQTGQLEAQSADARGELERATHAGRIHSDWLSTMYPRLFLARQLLSDDGVIFVSIDDNEVHHLRMLMNEVFGEENLVAQITVLTNPKGRGLGEHFARNHDYLVVYTRSRLNSELTLPKTEAEVRAQYPESDEGGRFRTLELRNTHRQFGRFNRPNLYFPLYASPKDRSVSLQPGKGLVEVLPNWDDGFEGCWAWGRKKVATEGQLLVGREVSGHWKVFRKAYANDKEGDVVRKKLKTIWDGKEYQTEKGQVAFDELVPGRVFQSPKPVELIKTQLRLINDPDAIVLDFFAGSGTTAQAILEMNREDGGNRRFVLVQYPEPTPKDSEARKRGFATVSAICKARITAAIQRLRSGDHELALAERELPEDLGVTVFSLQASNFRQWSDDPTPDKLASALETLELFRDPLLPGWDPIEVIYEIALKEAGYGPSCRIEQLDSIDTNVVYRVTDSTRDVHFDICLDDKLNPQTPKHLNLHGVEDLFVCRDVALDDTLAANLALQCRLRTV